MPNFYYSNPSLGVGISNLANALAKDPTEDVRAGLLGDQRQVSQVQRRKLEAEAMALETRAREHQAAQDSLGDTLAGAVVGLPQEHQQSTADVLRYVLQSGGGNASQLAGAFPKIIGMGYAQGGEEDRRTSALLGGRMPTADFSGTTERADNLIGAKAKNSLAEALQVENVRQAGAYSRQELANAGALERAKTPRPGAAGVGGGGTPLNVTSSAMQGIDTMLRGMANTVFGDLPEGSATEIDPTALQALRVRTAEIYQSSRNLPGAAVQAWQEIMGTDPKVDQTDRLDWNMFSPNAYRNVLRPGAPAAAAPSGLPKDRTPGQKIQLPNGAEIEFLAP